MKTTDTVKNAAGNAFAAMKTRGAQLAANKTAQDVAKVSAIVVGAGIGYAVFATIAQRTYDVLN